MQERDDPNAPPAEQSRQTRRANGSHGGAARRRATSYDVARLAGVSQSAVSRVYREGASASPETRRRVLAAAAELNYQPNALAQGLISKRSNLVAIIISDLTHSYYPALLTQLNRQLELHGFRTLLFTIPRERDLSPVITEILRHHVDGVISAVNLEKKEIRQIRSQGIALVLYNRFPALDDCSVVICDSAKGERLLVESLIAAGHDSFGIIAGPEDNQVGETRFHAILSTLQTGGFENPPYIRGDFSYESGRTSAMELIQKTPGINAIVCVTDLMAIGAIDTVKDLRKHALGTDISIVGFDGVDAADWASYKLTTIKQPIVRMGEAAVNMLMDRIIDQSVSGETRVFYGTLQQGSSSRMIEHVLE